MFYLGAPLRVGLRLPLFYTPASLRIKRAPPTPLRGEKGYEYYKKNTVIPYLQHLYNPDIKNYCKEIG